MTLFAYFSEFYGFQGLMILTESVTLVVAIKNYRRHPTLRIFPYYLSFSLLQMVSDCVAALNPGIPVLHSIGIAVTNLFMLFEFSVCTGIALRNITSRGRKWAIYINSVLFAALLTSFLISNYHHIYQATFFFFEDFFLLLPCLLYFYDFIVRESIKLFTNEPAFWVLTGFLVLNACSIPLLLAVAAAGRDMQDGYTLNYILYIALCFFLIRAYRCPPVNPPAHARAV